MSRERAVRWGLIAVALLPFLTAVVRAVATGWFPIGDSAQLYLRAGDVLTRHHPWLGSWSSLSVSVGTDLNNPGPLHADLMAPFAHLFGPTAGQAIGIATINAACVIGAAIAAHRIGGWAFERWVLVAAAALGWTLGSELLIDMFQGHALLFPFLLLLVLLAGASTGHPWVWPWVVAVGSLIVQTHVSYAYILTILGLTVVTAAVFDVDPPRPAPLGRALRSRAALWSYGVFALAWLQPVIEQLFGEGQGNLSRLAANASGGDVTVGLRNAVKLAGAVFTVPPWWTRWGFADTIQPSGAVDTGDGLVVVMPGLPDGLLSAALLAVLAGLLGWSWWRARRAGNRVLAAACMLSIAGLVGSVLSVSRLTVGIVGFAPHHVRWMFVIALCCHLTLIASLFDVAAERWPRPTVDRVATIAAGVAIVAFSVANVPFFAQRHGPTADIAAMPAMRRLFDDLDPLRDVQPVLYRTDNLRIYEPYSSAIQLQLQGKGIEFRVDHDSLLRHLGENRRADGTEPVTLMQFEGWWALAYGEPGCLLGRASALDEDGEAAIQAEAEALAGKALALDVSAVAGSPSVDDLDRELAAAFMAGVPETVRQVTYEGRLRRWVDLGLVTGDPALLTELAERGPVITDWLSSVVALVVTPEDVCPPTPG